MKILHVITLSELGGAQSVILNLAKQSVKDGHNVMVASSPGGELWKELPEEVRKVTLKSLQRAINPLKDWRVLRELKKLDSTFRPDVVHLHSSKIGILGRLAFSPKKIIYTVHGFDSIRIAFRKFLYLEKVLQFRARHIVAVSRYDHKNLLAEGISNNVSYIYNGISDFHSDLPNYSPQLEDIIEKISKSGKFNVISIARLAAPKRFDLFCEIASQLKDQDINFYWVGNKQPVDEHPDNVFCLGEVTNAHQLLPYTNAFMLLSDYEGMPMSILEALCYGIPVVASNVGGIGEVLNEKNGFALQNNKDTLITHLLKYKNNKELYENTKANARKSYLTKFTIREMYNSYLQLYKSIAG